MERRLKLWLAVSAVEVAVCLSMSLQTGGQEPPQTLPDLYLWSAPITPSPMQKAYEKLRLREMYERDKQDPRRVTVCI